jgi:hypothetical protein
MVGAAAAIQLIDVLLTQSALAAPLLGAFAADAASSRAGLLWWPSTKADPKSAPSGAAAGAKYAALGASIAIVTALAIALVGVALGWATIAAGSLSISFVFAIVRAAAIGLRDELVLRGIPLAVAERAGVSDRFALLFASLAGAASLASAPATTLPAIVLALTSGFAFALVFRRYGVFAASGAHAGWTLALGPLLRGDVLNVDWRDSALVIGSRAAGKPAWLAAAIVLVAGVGLAVAGPKRRAVVGREG